jgi:hypothetical protein
MSKLIVKKVLEHPDKDEIISKLISGFELQDISEWLKAKYNSVEESSHLFFSVKQLKTFKDEHLDIYQMVQESLQKDLNTAKLSLEKVSKQELDLSIKKNPKYKEKILELATQKLDIKKMLANMIVAAEERAGQVFDLIQENPENLKNDRVVMEWFDRLGSMLEKWWKYVEEKPDQVIQHNVSIQAINDYSVVFQEAIKETLSELDIEASMKFIEILNRKLAALNDIKKYVPVKTTTEALAEVQVLDAEITQKLLNG